VNVGVSAISLFVRRFPLEAGRWRLIPYALKKCQRNVTNQTIRTVRTRHGFRMRLDVSEWLGRHIFVTGEYEPSTTSVFKACLKRGDTFIDVGANAGYFTLLAANCVGPTGRVRSFEPLPQVRQALLTNIELNRFPNCVVSDVALSNEDGEAEFFAGPTSHYGVSSLRKLDDASATIRVRTAKFDDILSKSETVDLMKIDVEGAECHVLEGMQETLRHSAPDIIIEVSPKYLEGMDRSTADLDRLFNANGYRSYAIEHTGLRPLSSLVCYPSDQFNAFLTERKSLPPGLRVLRDAKVL
jgi:FkbM family methyltransferase